MKLLRLFKDHPASIGESYGEHLWHASGFGVRMVLGGVACIVHAVLPFVFERTASDVIAKLNKRMVVQRRSARRTVAAPGGTSAY